MPVESAFYAPRSKKDDTQKIELLPLLNTPLRFFHFQLSDLPDRNYCIVAYPSEREIRKLLNRALGPFAARFTARFSYLQVELSPNRADAREVRANGSGWWPWPTLGMPFKQRFQPIEKRCRLRFGRRSPRAKFFFHFRSCRRWKALP